MDILTTSLEALLQRATNIQNENVDTAAIEAFCALVNKENEGSHTAIRLLASKIHSFNEREALKTLGILDACMKKCGSSFQSEVGKFRFLNEMIKLVSPKYLGSQTSLPVRIKVLDLLQAWTEDYPRESKIKEAYDMLKKQGVVAEVATQRKSIEISPCAGSKATSIFDNDERSRLLQKLLRSKNPDDLIAANRLIKTMVKEDDRRAELVSKRHVELEAAQNNVRLLNEMLDSYRPDQCSADELDIINELYMSCEKLVTNLISYLPDSLNNDQMLQETLLAGENIGQVINKYKLTIVKGVQLPGKQSDEESLVDLLSIDDSQPQYNQCTTSLISDNGNKADNNRQSDIDVLCDIFSTTEISTPPILREPPILKPTTVQQSANAVGNSSSNADSDKTNSKLKALEELDALGKTLLKENLAGTKNVASSTFNRINEKVPMNLLTKHTASGPQNTSTNKILSEHSASTQELASGLDLNFLLRSAETKQSNVSTQITNGDDRMVDISNDNIDTKKCTLEPSEHTISNVNASNSVPRQNDSTTVDQSTTSDVKQKLDIKPLTDISVTLESVKPSSIPPLTVLEEKNGISVILHFAKDKPRDDVQVIVVTTISKNTSPLTNYLFQAVVPKPCKMKLQQPSGSELPAHNPFLPPSAITQIMLVANPNTEKVSLKFMISYTMDDELCTEMGEVDSLPSVL